MAFISVGGSNAMNVLNVAFRETKCVNIRIDLTRDIPLTVLGKYHNIGKKDRRMNLREIIYAEDFPPLADVLSEIVSGRQNVLNAHCRVNVGDEYHWVYLSCSLRKDTFNRTQHLTGTMMDVSEYFDTAENDFVLDGASKKNRERIDAAVRGQESTLADILGEDYLLRIQQALTVNNVIYSAIYDENGSPLVVPPAKNGQAVSPKKFKHKISREIRCNHKTMAIWTIASNDTDELTKTEPMLDVLAETVSQIANAIFVLYNEMENSKTANQQLGSNIEQQILLNNVYTIILENNDAVEALKMVIRMVGEYLKLDRISLYDYDSETGYSALNTDWSLEGINMESVFRVDDFPQLMEELNYCDTFFSGGSFTEFNKTGIKSFVVSQLSANGKFVGLIFYETITRERIWSSAEKKLLRNISQIVSTMMIRCNMDAALREQNDRLKKLAFTDPVLRIPNRTCLDRDLGAQLENGISGAAVSMKITNINTVNEAFGHIHSDDLLKKTAQYICDISSADTQVYRFSGSVLMILIKNCDREGAKEFLDILLERFTRPWTVAGEEHYLEMNAGIGFYPRGEDSCDDIYRRSTLALYRAVEEDPNRYAFYLEGSEEKAGSAYNSELRLRRAVIGGMKGFSVKYLPIIDIDGHIIALEAGVCWKDGDNGEIPAERVISIAESIGLDENIDTWVIDRSCALLREIIDLSGQSELVVNINLTSHELQRSAVHRMITTAVEKYGLSGRNLAVEIPEESQLKIGGDIAPILNTLTDMGVRVIIDDFGREYMSLSSLKIGSISKIKMRAEQFVNADEFDSKALESVIELAHKMGISVCVKHIDNRECFEAVCGYDVDLLQGEFLAGRYSGENAKKLFKTLELTAISSKLRTYT